MDAGKLRKNKKHDEEKKLISGSEGGGVVEYKPLGEVAEIVRGVRITKKELIENGQFPVFHGGLIPLGFYNKYNRKANQTMIINTGSIGEVVWSGVDFWSSDGTFVVQVNQTIIEDRFLYYFLKTKEHYLKSQKRTGGVPTIDRSVIEKIVVPLPPLDLQRGIVDVLDRFTELSWELLKRLEQEQIQRRRQYEYYRDKLLDFSDVSMRGGVVEYKPLGEVAEFKRGKIITAKEATFGDIPVISGGQKPAYYHNEHNRTGETITIAGSGAYAGFVMYWNTPIFVGDAFSIKSHLSAINIKYIYYFLLHNQQKIYGMKKGSGVPHVYSKDVASLKIPIPPLSEQMRIVGILDKFDTLVNSLDEGLPKEIALRQKQYEYYRGKLLSFPHPAADMLPSRLI